MKKKILSLLLLIIIISLSIFLGYSLSNKDANKVSEQKAGDYSQNMTTEASKQLEKELGAFEITARHRALAKKNEAGYSVLDAGRGNPNWINSKTRYAYTRLMDFATKECERDFNNGDMAGQCIKQGISERFDNAMDMNNEIDAFLKDAIDYCVDELKMDKDDLLFELTNGIIGDYYPTPSRCLVNTEKILNSFLQENLYNGEDLKDKTDIFPTEGGTAAICYIFNSLSHNKILNPGDKIALATPIFTPYLEIPDINNYGLVSVNVSSTKEDSWDISEDEIKKLEDTNIKAFFLVNPSNPSSHALSNTTLKRLEEVVKKNSSLIIITDDVYGTFVDNFQTIYSKIPYNTILVYSFSKLYGVTGWRTGLIAMNKNNVVDELLSKLDDVDKEKLRIEYKIVEEDPDSMKFIDRMTADSRSIGLYHTSGLSTPSQIFMDIMALSNLVCKGNDKYIEQTNEILNERYITLMNALELEADTSKENAQYYALVNIDELIALHYNESFVKWKQENISDIDFLSDLASKKGVVLMYGPGFDAPQGSVRISLANLNTKDYKEIAKRIMELLDEYYQKYEQ